MPRFWELPSGSRPLQPCRFGPDRYRGHVPDGDESEGSQEQPGAIPPAKVLLPFEVLLIVRAGNLGDLVGARETDQVDFKSASYNLDLDKDKQDLIADVAELANARGGVLVLGVKTVVHANEKVEVAASVPGFKAGLVAEERYRKVLQTHIAPLVRDIRFHFADVVTDEEQARQIAVIEVSAQHEYDKPFFVDRLLGDQGQRMSHAIAWPERSGDGTHWHPKERVQQLVAAGLRSQTQFSVEPQDQEPAEEMAAAFEAAGVAEGSARLGVQVIPKTPANGFTDFYGDDAQALRLWRPIRASGFGFDLGWHPPEPRGSRFVAPDTNASLVLNRRGILTIASSFETRSFLWNSPEPGEFLQINPFALTEWIAEVARLAYDFVGPRLSPETWEVLVVAHDLRPSPTVQIRPPNWLSQARLTATVSDAEIRKTGTGDWEVDSYELLVEIIGTIFGRPPTALYGVDHEAKRVDLRSIDRFRG